MIKVMNMVKVAIDFHETYAELFHIDTSLRILSWRLCDLDKALWHFQIYYVSQCFNMMHEVL